MAGAATVADAVEMGMRTLAARMFTSLPAEVVAYDPVTNTITAKIVVKAPYFKSDGEREYDEYPLLPRVPVMWMRGGGNLVATGLIPGDFVWLVFSSLSLAEWRVTGQLSEPTDSRRLSIGYPYAIPGAFPDVEPLSPLDAAALALGQMIVGQEGGVQMRAGPTGIEFAPAGVTAISPIALAAPLLTFVTLIAAATTAGGSADAAVKTALTNIQAALAAIVAIPANAGAAGSVTTSGASVTAAGTALTTSGTAATAAAAGATTAAGAVPSTVARAL